MNTDERIKAALRSRPSGEPTYAEPLAGLVPASGVQRVRPVMRSRVRTGALAAIAMLIVLAIGAGMVTVGLSSRPAAGPAVGSEGAGSTVAPSETPALAPSPGCSIVPAVGSPDVCGVNPSTAPSASSNAGPTPAATFELYIVRPGDNLQKIAAERNLQVWELELANPRIADLNHIVIGETLNIPGPGQMSPPSAAPSVP
jgi:LysM repeat protein